MTEIISKPIVNILETSWMKTEQGLKSPRDVLQDNIKLSQEVPGYVYGAQFRFLLTIVPLIVKASSEDDEYDYELTEFDTDAIDHVFRILEPHSNLLCENQPFLQVLPHHVDPNLEGVLVEPRTSPSKLLPEGQSADDRQTKFWNFNKVSDSLSIPETILALVCFYFYGPGTNTNLVKGKLRLSNGSSALRYLNSIEIIPAGETLIESLLMSMPRDFLDSKSGKLLPHWADRECVVMDPLDPLWKFSWSSNTVYCKFSENFDSLIGITRGCAPLIWSKAVPLAGPDKDWAKTYHDSRQIDDPLYFYFGTSDGEVKMWRGNISTDPYYTVAQWHYESLSTRLKGKLATHYLDYNDYLMDMVFLEHSTEGSAQSFNIRYSRTSNGWKDELIPQGQNPKLLGSAQKVMIMKGKLTGMFTEKGTCKHIAARKPDVENYYWNECQSIILDILHSKMNISEVENRLTEAAIKAFERVSSNRDTVHFEAHVRGLQNIKKTFQGTPWTSTKP